MARGSRSRREISESVPSSADLSTVANPMQGLLDDSPLSLPSDPVSYVDNFLGDSLPYDRRLFSFGEPEPYRLGLPQNVTATSPSYGREHIGFQRPEYVSICVRRKRRKEVLHALGRTRSGGRRRRTWRSDYRC